MSRIPVIGRSAVLVALSLACALIQIPSASFAANGTTWTASDVPVGISPTGPISCVQGTEFCAVLGGTSVAFTDGTGGWTPSPLPNAISDSFGLSCPTTTTCWVAGYYPNDGASGWAGPALAETTDGGKTWSMQTPNTWLDLGRSGAWQANSIDCVSADICWVAGQFQQTPPGVPTGQAIVAVTTDGGNTWTSFSDRNLPWTVDNIPQASGLGVQDDWLPESVSCVSAMSCVVVGNEEGGDGLNPDGSVDDAHALSLSTVDGGATWYLSSDPTFAAMLQVNNVSCVPSSAGLGFCVAVGGFTAGLNVTPAPMLLTSTDNGVSWSGSMLDDVGNYAYGIECIDSLHCWATTGGGYGIDDAGGGFVGTDDGGATWHFVPANEPYGGGGIGCTSVDDCIADSRAGGGGSDNGWTTTDAGDADGVPDASLTPIPALSQGVVDVHAGGSQAIAGQAFGSAQGTGVNVAINASSGGDQSTTATVGADAIFSTQLNNVEIGTTNVTFSIGGVATGRVAIQGYPDAAPTVSGLRPSIGSSEGGTVVTVHGAGLSQAQKVYFGKRQAMDVHVLGDTSLTCDAPAGDYVQDVRVVTANGGWSAPAKPDHFAFANAPKLRSLSPHSGSDRGGTTVTLEGAGLAWVNRIRFGSRRGTHLHHVSPGVIRITTPAGSGRTKVVAESPWGVSKPITFKYRRR